MPPSFYVQVRERLGLSQLAMSRWLGLSYQYVHHLEHGERLPPVPTQLCYLWLDSVQSAIDAIEHGSPIDALLILRSIIPKEVVREIPIIERKTL